MTSDLKTVKDGLRAEAKRARGLLSLSASEQDKLSALFFDNISLSKGSIIATYWSKRREIDSHQLIEELLQRGHKVALPIVEEGSRILKFANYDNDTELVTGEFGVCHPLINEDIEWLEPDIFIVPLLAFDRKGYRLGYGGGYYDATLVSYKKPFTAIGLAYAQQACLFNLPRDDHDIRMDWIITQQDAHSFI